MSCQIRGARDLLYFRLVRMDTTSRLGFDRQKMFLNLNFILNQKYNELGDFFRSIKEIRRNTY